MGDVFDRKRQAHEEEYFERTNKAALEKIKRSPDAEEVKGASPACPRDQAPMNDEEMGDVKFKRCPKCRGVWIEEPETRRLFASIPGKPSAFWRAFFGK